MATILGFEFCLFYYLRGKNKKPAVTVGLAKRGDWYFRGISICSPKEEPDKEIGKAWAFRRILRAYRICRSINKETMHHSIRVCQDGINHRSSNMISFVEKYKVGIPFDSKTYAVFYEDLTNIEKKLVDTKFKKMVN